MGRIYLLISLIITGIIFAANGFAPIWLLMIIPVFLGICALHTIGMLVLAVIYHKKEKPKKFNNSARAYTLMTISLLFDVFRTRIKTSGLDKVPDTPFLFVGNHQSAFDPMVAMLVLRKHNLAFVSKKENIAIPIGGEMMVVSGTLSMDRDDNRQAIGVINEAAENMKSGKCSMGIYPEGGTNKNPKEIPLNPFHNGSFKCATKAGVPIVVGVISNSRGFQKRFFRPCSTIWFDIIGVISAEEVKSSKTSELSEKTRDMILKYMEEAKSK